MTSIYFFAFSLLFSFYCRSIVILFSLLLFGEVQGILHVHYFVLVFQWVSLEGVVTHTKPSVIVGCNNTKQSNLNLCSRKLFGLFWRSLAHSEVGCCLVRLPTHAHTHPFPPHAACPASLCISSLHLSHANQHVFLSVIYKGLLGPPFCNPSPCSQFFCLPLNPPGLCSLLKLIGLLYSALSYNFNSVSM